MNSANAFSVRPEVPSDVDQIRMVNLDAFPGRGEAELVDKLRRSGSWIPEFSVIAESHGKVIGHALATRCYIGGHSALALAPCAVLREHQHQGVGTAVIRALLEKAEQLGECFVIVLGHPEYYPRFGFQPAVQRGISLSIEVPEEALMILKLGDVSLDYPTGQVVYDPAFGI
ncbi:N-acetyltransferase [Corynebacterium breve]|uniref:N-acetyltransferase n=1 Tax=Corynebacterium breve TaxID=3049799 RepID=A0ABY8VGB0_9CORY|nr:N-acetyltransferase [Corynebacterium breve]WIM68533.1 N-acetyltransferase [Corynebacterium breve]